MGSRQTKQTGEEEEEVGSTVSALAKAEEEKVKVARTWPRVR